MHALRIAADLGAQRALRRRMLGIGGDLDRAPGLDRHTHRAGVGAIMRAYGTSEFSRGIHRRSVRGDGERWSNAGFYYGNCRVGLRGAAKNAFGVESVIIPCPGQCCPERFHASQSTDASPFHHETDPRNPSRSRRNSDPSTNDPRPSGTALRRNGDGRSGGANPRVLGYRNSSRIGQNRRCRCAETRQWFTLRLACGPTWMRCRYRN